jgi:uncharacterized RDD family membrane protein YckC
VRVGAYLIDGFILLPVGAAFGWQTRAHHGQARALLLVLSLVVGASYEVIGIAIWGQTIGKRIRGLRVMGDQAATVGFRRSAIRWAVRGLGPVTLIGQLSGNPLARFATGAIVSVWTVVLLTSMANDDHHRGFHDRAAATTVYVAE